MAQGVKKTFFSCANVHQSRIFRTYLKGDGGLSSSMRKKTTLDCAVYQRVSSVVSHQLAIFTLRRA